LWCNVEVVWKMYRMKQTHFVFSGPPISEFPLVGVKSGRYSVDERHRDGILSLYYYCLYIEPTVVQGFIVVNRRIILWRRKIQPDKGTTDDSADNRRYGVVPPPCRRPGRRKLLHRGYRFGKQRFRNIIIIIVGARDDHDVDPDVQRRVE